MVKTLDSGFRRNDSLKSNRFSNIKTCVGKTFDKPKAGIQCR